MYSYFLHSLLEFLQHENVNPGCIDFSCFDSGNNTKPEKSFAWRLATSRFPGKSQRNETIMNTLNKNEFKSTEDRSKVIYLWITTLLIYRCFILLNISMRKEKLKSFRYLFYVGTSFDHNKLVIAVTFVDNFKVKLE